MADPGHRIAIQQKTIGPLLVLAVLIGIVGLPIAVWLDLRELSERVLRSQAEEISGVIDQMRAFYASDVVGRVLQSDGQSIQPTHNYRGVDGGIPIPATLSIELGNRISAERE